MSRTIEQKDGRVIETIKSMDECLFLWNGMCCDDRSVEFASNPGEKCKSCAMFTTDDGVINR